MAISGIQDIGIGLPNESANSDSLYTAFTKTVTNFNTLFACASPYNTFTGANGILTSSDANTNTITITNTGVTSLTAGTGVTLSGTTGDITISASGGGNGSGGTVTSVGLLPVSTSRLVVSNSPIVSDGVMSIDLANSGAIAGSYTYPAMTVDQYGRVTSIANAASVGTVTSVGMITSGIGIQLSGSPITTAGNITILNTGVTRLSAGTGINLSGSNGNVTISTTTTGGTVTSVGLSSSSLTVTNSPVTSVGTINVELPSSIVLAGPITSNTSGIGYSTGAGGTVTQITSRTTGVTINKISGSITLVSAAGSASYATFTVTNSTVAATDVIIVNQKAGTDKYESWISNVNTGSFDITFADTSGTTTEQPVFNFAVIKAVAA